ncbi:hypothetical protein Trydic_g11634 [Trypoxylus dichotomus]
MRNLRNCLLLIHVEHLKNCLPPCVLINPQLENVYAWEIVQKAGNWIPHELKERDIERRLITCVPSTARKKGSFASDHRWR